MKIMCVIFLGDLIWREFMDSTKYKNLGETDEVKSLPHPPLELEIDPQVEGVLENSVRSH
jgi:hypothetical protein